MSSSREKKAPEGNPRKGGEQANKGQGKEPRPSRQDERAKRGPRPITGIATLTIGKPADLNVVARQLEAYWAGKEHMGPISKWIVHPELQMDPISIETFTKEEYDLMDESERKTTKDTAAKLMVQERFERRNRMLAQYAHIQQQLSQELTDRVEATPEYEAVHKARDPIGLWKLVMNCVYVRDSGIDELDMTKSVEAYMALKQRPDETVGDYKRRHIAVAHGMEVTYEQSVRRSQAGSESIYIPQHSLLAPAMQAAHFLRGLGPQYDGMKDHIYNSARLDDRPGPSTVQEVFELATNWQITSAGKQTSVEAYVFSTKTDELRQHGNKDKSKGAAKGGGAKTVGAKGGDGKASESKPKGKGGGKEWPCGCCGKTGHKAHECPVKQDPRYKAVMAEIADDKGTTKATRVSASQGAELARQQLEMLTDTMAYVNQTILPAGEHEDLVESLEDMPLLEPLSDDESDDEQSEDDPIEERQAGTDRAQSPHETAPEPAQAEASTIMSTRLEKPFLIGFDSMSNINITDNFDLLEDPIKLSSSPTWNTSEGTTKATITHVGTFEGVPLLYSSGMQGTVLSPHQLRKAACTIKTIGNYDSHVVTFPTGRDMHFLPGNDGLYQCQITPVVNVTTVNGN